MQKGELQLVICHDKKAITTSLIVADKFGKKHADVLKDITNLICSKRFRAQHFEISTYDVKGKSQPMQQMTRDGFILLSLSFAGIRSIKRREDVIDEFNTMQALVEHKTAPELLSNYTGRAKAGERIKNVPRGYWSLFDEYHYVVLLAAKAGDNIKHFDLVEERIRKAWNAYRKRHDAFKFSYSRTFIYEFGDERGSKECDCYLDKELPLFMDWLKEVYKKEEMRRYLYHELSDKKSVLHKIDIAFPPAV